MSRPEHEAPPEIFYDEDEAAKYTSSSRMIEVQSQMAERALELLNLPEGEPSLLLDLGCGSGLSGEILSEHGHTWVGLDVSMHMLNAALERESEGDLLLADLGDGLAFRTGVFDGAISVSMLQWLCNADKKSHVPMRRLRVFFESLYKTLRRGARAVFQFYPEGEKQVEMITLQAVRAGFSGGIVVDYPNSTKAKKVYLCLMCGGTQVLPRGLAEEGGRSSHEVSYAKRRGGHGKHFKAANLPGSSRRELVVQKKERRRKHGKSVPLDSKYSGRIRKHRF